LPQFKNAEQINKFIKKTNFNTIKIKQKNIKDIYYDNWDYIIQRELEKQFIIDTWEELYTLTTKELNLVKRVINEVALIYKNPAERKALLTEQTDNQEEQIDERYNQIIEESMLDVVMKSVNRFTELLNNLLVRPVWRNGKIQYDMYLFDNVEIITDPEDWKQIIAVKYYMGLQLPFYDNQHSGLVDDTPGANAKLMSYNVPDDFNDREYDTFKYAYLWTLENKDELTGRYRESYIYKIEQVNEQGQEQITEKKENPYKDKDGYPILPFVLFKKEYPVDRLLNFTVGDDLKDLTINTAINLVHYNALVKYTAWKQKYIVTDDIDSIPAQLNMAPQGVAVLPKRQDGSVELGTWDQESDLVKYWNALIERVKTGLAQYGLDADSFQRSGNGESGIKLKIKKEGIIERRQDQIPLYREYEHQLFEMTRIVNNYHSTDEISDKAEFQIDFGEIKVENDSMEEANVWQTEITNNVSTPVDWIMQNNPDLDDEQAREIFEKNKAINGGNLGNIPTQPIKNPRSENALREEEEEEI
jgi:hypothetical protein